MACHNCGGCGAARPEPLNEIENQLLDQLAQNAFLPLCRLLLRSPESKELSFVMSTPVYLPDAAASKETVRAYGAALLSLQSAVISRWIITCPSPALIMTLGGGQSTIRALLFPWKRPAWSRSWSRAAQPSPCRGRRRWTGRSEKTPTKKLPKEVETAPLGNFLFFFTCFAFWFGHTHSTVGRCLSHGIVKQNTLHLAALGDFVGQKSLCYHDGFGGGSVCPPQPCVIAVDFDDDKNNRIR